MEGVQAEDVKLFDLGTRRNDAVAGQGGESLCQKLLVGGKLHFNPVSPELIKCFVYSEEEKSLNLLKGLPIVFLSNLSKRSHVCIILKHKYKKGVEFTRQDHLAGG